MSGKKLKREFSICVEEEDGWEWHVPVNLDATELKSICINWENNLQFGRIIDLDVFDNNHNRISREDLGNTGRTCIVCGDDYLTCRRIGKHSFKEIRSCFDEISREI
ncbi:MAG: citrate lyase holo-[acyl-carrier protein] synthase [Candidatus Coatesbacteria bacterium]|nr:citrate lyase holo-[acyl-carrier protein] synthase [Candidatus Coatesbacteria bacterium]